MSDENLVKETLALMASSTSREGVQAIRLASQNKTVDIATHKDTTTGQEVVLWSDIIMVFRDALYLQYGTKAIPFLKGPEFKVLDPLRIAAVPGATLEVVVHEDDDDDQVYGLTSTVSKRVTSSRGSASKSLKSPTKQKVTPQRSSKVPPTPTSPPPIPTTHSSAPQALLLDITPNISSVSSNETTSQGSFFSLLFSNPTKNLSSSPSPSSFYSKVTPEAPTVRQQRGIRVTSNAPLETSSVESLAEATNSQATTNNQDQHNAALRNPQYGLVEEALANYNHIDVPEEALKRLEPHKYKNYARNPQCASDTPTDIQLASNTNQGRAPQEYGKLDEKEYSNPTKLKSTNETITWADQGDPEAQVALGNLYRHGSSDLKKDSRAAMDWYLKAAEQEYDLAQYSVGILYYLGEGVQQDYAMAEKWFRKAAAQEGEPVFPYMLGKLYEEGHGTHENPDEAQSWYLKAAARNYIPAQLALGSLLVSGQGGRIPEKDRNYSGAMDWYLKAAHLGDAQAHYEIGQMFEEGTGVVQDDLKARQWYTQAFARGHTGAEERLTSLRLKSQAQVEPKSGTLKGLFSMFF
ncbi:hypothetical protein BKA57DRAFT_475255 [Linnemannia elongata]|nr:hypothetical protein BKA57DRAFT_475255 [Linnemannia elongata]